MSETRESARRRRPWRTPVSTYRLQLQASFTFADARALVPYLADLGITDCYSSPHLKAHPGSTHGYDICDHGQLNPELGTPEEFAAWCAELQAHDLGHIVDIVPNHMACDPTANPWWRDVLENGPGSPHASYFDIEWSPVKPELEDRVLLPVLGDQYGRVLERGELQLAFRDGTLHLTYFAMDLPISPREAPRVLGLHLDRLEQQLGAGPALREYLSILTAYKNLPSYTERDPERVAERQREKEVARERLLRLVAETPEIGDHIEACVRTVNGTPGDPASFDDLHALLEHQAYRLAYWRTAVDEINYRRFFDVNELAGLRTERPEVFEATHRLLARFIGAGQVTGVRVDHPDGLFDPGEYFARLQALAHTARTSSAGGGDDDRPLYVAAEKILSRGEQLRDDWAVMGTTGYGFLNLVAGLFVDSRHTTRLRRIYGQVTGRQTPFEEVAYASKITIMQTAMASELNVLAHALNRISERDRRQRDFTLNSCGKLLREVVACYQVYRTYVSPRGVTPFDRRAVDTAIAEARRRNPLMEASIFEFLRSTLLPPEAATVGDTVVTDEMPPADADSAAARERVRFAMRLQQVTGPVQAKGVEDTAFYRYNVLVSANDVGGHPSRLDVSPAEFHEANERRLACWPLEMVTTATHDTKRGEDARLRIAAISECPSEWRSGVSDWMRYNGRHRTEVVGHWAPDRNDEYLFYQTLAGVWPAEPLDAPLPSRAPEDLVERVIAYMQKATREAKVHTSWLDENAAYSQAVSRFITQALTGRSAPRFLRSFLPLQRRLSRIGMHHSLAQVVLKMTVPGVADFYQGGELWDFNLVDPDNRRPVDFGARRRMLDQLRPLLDGVEQDTVPAERLEALLRQAEDGRAKLFVTVAGLRARRAHAAICLEGAYVPLGAEGPPADHLVAFARVHASGTLVTIVPRLVGGLLMPGATVIDPGVWGATRVRLPREVPHGRWRHVFTGAVVDARDHEGGPILDVGDVLRTWPVAMLVPAV